MPQTQGYIHTFTRQEQDRLISQALFLERYLYGGIDFSRQRSVLEVGCGVGAQIHIMLRRFPNTHFTGVDHTPIQIERARELLGVPIAEGRVALHEAQGERLPFADASFDSAYIFWVLEHLGNPLAVLNEIRRVLKPGAAFYATEVFDSAVFMHPANEAVTQYLRAFTVLQAELGGDPDVGAKLAGLMAQSGFADINLRDVSPMLDARMKDHDERVAFIAYFTALLQSAAGPLLEKRRVSDDLVAAIAPALHRLIDDPAAIFTWGARQTRAVRM